MEAAPIPANEIERLLELAAADILETPAEAWFDVFTECACALFGAPVAIFSLVDAERQWFKSRIGLAIEFSARAVSFCAHGIAGDERTLVVPDATKDRRFMNNPFVTGPAGVRFYAGAVVRGRHGLRLGSLCILDTRPRQISAQEVADLEALANNLETVLEHHRRNTYATGCETS